MHTNTSLDVCQSYRTAHNDFQKAPRALNEVMALLEGSQEGDVDDRMEVVTQGSNDDLDAQKLGDVRRLEWYAKWTSLYS